MHATRSTEFLHDILSSAACVTMPFAHERHGHCQHPQGVLPCDKIVSKLQHISDARHPFDRMLTRWSVIGSQSPIYSIEEPSAYGVLVSSCRISRGVNGKLSTALAKFLETKLSICRSRLYMKFNDVQNGTLSASATGSVVLPAGDRDGMDICKHIKEWQLVHMVEVGFVGHLPIRSLSSQKELTFRLIAGES